MAVILCFGDSNTYGAPADDPEFARLPYDVRWTGQLQTILGVGHRVIEEGLNGRTTDLDHADRPYCHGRRFFVVSLLSHAPIDVVVVMLGSNDLKAEFDRPVEDIAGALDGYLDDVSVHAPGAAAVLVSPIHIDDSQPLFAEWTSAEFDADSVAKSRRLADGIRRVARAWDTMFLDAATVARAGGDGLHLSLDSQRSLARAIAALVS